MCVNVEWFHPNIAWYPRFMTWLAWGTIFCYLDRSKQTLVPWSDWLEIHTIIQWSNWYKIHTQSTDIIGAKYMPKCSTLICVSNILVPFNMLTCNYFFSKKKSQKSFSQLHTTALFFSSGAFECSSLCFKQISA